MAWPFGSVAQMLLFLSVFLLAGRLRSGEAASFKFSIYHRFSDSVKGILDSEGLPEKHSPGYYATMVHRDRLLHGRRLASSNGDTPLMFVYGNETYNIDSLGFLYYANVSVGTPGLPFLVALDTGSDLFWLPCECRNCSTYLNTTDGGKFRLNHYSPNASTTSATVPCSNSLCELSNQCTSNKNTCPYKIRYLSANTSSAGYLVEDVLHLAADDSQLKPVDARITLGCGKVQTGIFAESAAPNGLIGLGMEKISVPSFLASQGLTPDSFSMCFGYDGLGRIEFGDIGPSGQRETPFNPMSSSYNVTFIQIIVIGKPNNVEFTAIFDSGTSFTYLTDPIYSLITEKVSYLQSPFSWEVPYQFMDLWFIYRIVVQMDAAMELSRFTFDSDFPFEYCYELPPETIFLQPRLNFTMEGGYNYGITAPYVGISTDDAGGFAVCLAIVKSTDIDLIGQNFMTGYRIVFNREKMVLGWKEVDCYDYGAATPSGGSPPTEETPPSGDSAPAPSSSGRSNSTQPLPGNETGDAARLNPLACVFVAILLILAVV